MNVWTWCRYSYCWELSEEMFTAQLSRDEFDQHYRNRYMEATGVLGGPWPTMDAGSAKELHSLLTISHYHTIEVQGRGELPQTHSTVDGTWRGRLILEGHSLVPLRMYFDIGASRWTGASVAGLVVGAMGVFVFALHLRRWLRVRRLGAVGVSSAEEGSAS
jgi:hypothetical protein